jgi:hypothetical protein
VRLIILLEVGALIEDEGGMSGRKPFLKRVEKMERKLRSWMVFAALGALLMLPQAASAFSGPWYNIHESVLVFSVELETDVSFFVYNLDADFQNPDNNIEILGAPGFTTFSVFEDQGEWFVSKDSETISLGAKNWFGFFFLDDTDYVLDYGVQEETLDTYSLSYEDSTVIVHDVKPIPIPPAAFLLGGGLLGVVFLRRRFKRA